MNVVLIPGLGYTHRIFEKLSLPYPCTYLNWIEPLKQEAIGDYAKRFSRAIPTDAQQTVLIGHSFGGVMAQEITSYRHIDKIILISSVKSSKEIPLFFQLMKPLALYPLFTQQLAIQSFPYWGKAHGFQTDEEQNLFKEMVSTYSDNYLQWALKTLSGWKEVQLPTHSRLVHIHGDRDKTFPLNKIQKADIVVEGGSHIMVYKQAKRIEKILNLEIGK